MITRHHGAGMGIGAQRVQDDELVARIEGRHRLVREQHRRPGGQRAGQESPGPLSSRQGGGGPVREGFESGRRQGVAHRLPSRRRERLGTLPVGQAAQGRHGGDREWPGHGAALRQVGDQPRPLPRRMARKGPPVEEDPAVPGRQEAREAAHQGGLAGAVGTHDHRQRAALEGQLRAVQDGAAAEDDPEGLRMKPGHAGVSASSALRRAITKRKNGTPRSAVSTPTLTSLCVGIRRTALSAASSSAAPARPEGRSVRAGS